MEFCPKCGMRMELTVREKKPKRVVMKCISCGYKPRSKGRPPPKTLTPFEAPPKESVVVIDEKEAKLKTLPTEKVKCPKCGNAQAYAWMVQTRGADESSTQFFRCTRCGTTWREYS